MKTLTILQRRVLAWVCSHPAGTGPTVRDVIDKMQQRFDSPRKSIEGAVALLSRRGYVTVDQGQVLEDDRPPERGVVHSTEYGRTLEAELAAFETDLRRELKGR